MADPTRNNGERPFDQVQPLKATPHKEGKVSSSHQRSRQRDENTSRQAIWACQVSLEEQWPRSLVLNLSCSAYFFSRNSVFLSQQFSRNRVFQPVSAKIQTSQRARGGIHIGFCSDTIGTWSCKKEQTSDSSDKAVSLPSPAILSDELCPTWNWIFRERDVFSWEWKTNSHENNIFMRVM